jgi:hypothetical protein
MAAEVPAPSPFTAVLKTLSERIASPVAQNIRESERPRQHPGELRERTKIAVSPNSREKATQRLQKGADIDSKIQSTIERMQERLDRKRHKPDADPAEIAEDQADLDALRTDTMEQANLTRTGTYDALHKGAEAESDTHTNVFTSEALINNLADEGWERIFGTAQTDQVGLLGIKSKEDLLRVKRILIDMMLFHYGNDRLTPDGFDKRISLLMNGLIGISSYSEDDKTGEKDMYPPEIQSELPEVKLAFDRFFPEGSRAYNRLRAFKAQGCNIIPVRVNAGGSDEFEFGFTGVMNRQQEREAFWLINHVICSTTFSPIRNLEIMTPEQMDQNEEFFVVLAGQREREFAAFHDLTDNLRIHGSQPISEMSPDSVKQAADKAYRFYGHLREVLRQGSGHHHGIITNPHREVTMDYAMFGDPDERIPTIEDALSLFFTGTNKDGVPYIDQNGLPMKGFLLMGPDNRPLTNVETGELLFDPDKIEEYATSLADKISIQLSPEDLQNDAIVLKKIQIQMLRDVFRNMTNYQNVMVNGRDKKEAKKRLVIEALRYDADPSKVMTASAAAVSNRMVAGFSNDDLYDIYSELVERYQQIFYDITEEIPAGQSLILESSDHTFKYTARRKFKDESKLTSILLEARKDPHLLNLLSRTFIDQLATFSPGTREDLKYTVLDVLTGNPNLPNMNITEKRGVPRDGESTIESI